MVSNQRTKTMKYSSGNDGFGFGIYNDNYPDEDKSKMAIPPSHTTMEDSLSDGLLKLSITDRNAMEEEIHGVRCMGVTKETPDLLQRSLKEFDRELMSIKNSPSRIATIQNAKDSYQNRRRSSKNNNQASPIDVLMNVIDTSQDTTTSPISTSTSSTTPQTGRQECYLNHPDVRLRFLRCENFDAKAAAKRFVSFFDLASEVFGDYVAVRPIRLSDFYESPEGGSPRRRQQLEKKVLSNSRVQYLPFRDRSGRRVKVGVGECNAEHDVVLRMKINLLLDWIASDDVETQQKGLVLVVWPHDPPSTSNASSSYSSGSSSSNRMNSNNNNNNAGASSSSSSGGSSCSETDDEGNWEGFLRPKYSKNDVAYHKRYYDAQPLRVAAIHWCSQDKPIYRVLSSLYYFSMDSKSQARYKVHFGEPLEIRYILKAFGIPVDLLPLTHTMALKRQNHSHWMTCRRIIEEQLQHQLYQQHQYQQQQYQQQQIQQQQQSQQHFLQQPWDDEQALKFFESTAAINIITDVSRGVSTDDLLVVVECPRSYDVIIGKAKVCTNNPGNGFYSSLIEATHNEHDSMVHARDKVAMTWRILLKITEELDGRFLDWNKALNAWVVIQDRIVIRKKIANSYKEYKRSRYVTARSGGNHKKKQAPNDPTNNESSSGNTTNNSAMFKRQKISGCLGNGCGESQKEIQSMFAAL